MPVLGSSRRDSASSFDSTAMRFPLFLFAVLGATAIITPPALATVLLDEPFNYPDGGLLANSGGNWTTFAGASQPLTVMNNAVVGLSHGTGVPSREDLARAFAVADVTSGELYLSFSFTVNT